MSNDYVQNFTTFFRNLLPWTNSAYISVTDKSTITPAYPLTIIQDCTFSLVYHLSVAQNNKPIAFFSRKLNPAQRRYTTTERELLGIVETLKEFRNILLGHKILVYTDHKNLTYTNFNTDRVMRWRLILEEYGPELIYTKGSTNIVADAFSRLETEPTNES